MKKIYLKKNISTLRLKKGLKHVQLAKLLKLKRVKTIIDWQNGQEPTITNLIKLCEVFKVSINQILFKKL